MAPVRARAALGSGVPDRVSGRPVIIRRPIRIDTMRACCYPTLLMNCLPN
jgi:hypothetical protein